MSDIRQWLEDLGLGQYADAFEREEVDLDTLPDLTEPMLKEMGLPIGPRAKVLRAAKSLRIDDTLRDETVPIKTGQPKPEADVNGGAKLVHQGGVKLVHLM